MANKCDLEETKQLAIQKFIEYTQKPEDWYVVTSTFNKSPRISPSDWDVYLKEGREMGRYKHKFSKFSISVYRTEVFLGDSHLAYTKPIPVEKNFATLKSGERKPIYPRSVRGYYDYGVRYEDTRVWKPLTKAQRARYEKAVKEYEDCPIRAAIGNVTGHFTRLANERVCEEMRRDMGMKPINPQIEKPYSINNGYDPEPNALTTWIKNWWAK